MKNVSQETINRGRPKLTDPEEWAIIKKIHFKERPTRDKLEQREYADRMDKRAKQKNHAR